MSFETLFYKMLQQLLDHQDNNKIYLWYIIFYLLDNKDLLRPNWCVGFHKNIFLFWYSHTLSSLNLRSWSLCSRLYSICITNSTTAGFTPIVLWYVLLYLLTISFVAFVNYFFLFVKVLVSISATTDFCSLSV